MDECIHRVECKACQDRYDEVNHSQNRRLDALEDEIKEVRRINVQLAEMAQSLRAMTEELARQGQRLEIIEREPAQKWKQAVWLVVSVVVTATVTYALSRIGMH